MPRSYPEVIDSQIPILWHVFPEKDSTYLSKRPVMLENYLKIAWRNIWKSKVFSAINILGLATGLACCILMFLFIQHELSFDKFHDNARNIYRVTSVPVNSEEKKTLAVTPAPWGPLMIKDYPEIKEVVRVLKDQRALTGIKGKEHSFVNNTLFVDSSFFNVFSFRLIQGNAATVLTQPNTIVLTRDLARRYFGDLDPVGQPLEITTAFTSRIDVTVTGIVDEPPPTSHMKFEALLSMSTLGDMSGHWSYHMHNTYVVLENGVSKQAVEEKLKSFSSKYIDNNPNADGKQEIQLQALTDIHLRSHLIGELETNGDITYVYIFSGIALFVLLIACLNFMNLSTVRSLKRAKEVGLRKVVGAERLQLVRQFLTESVLISFFSLLLAMGIVALTLPLFSLLAERTLKINWTGDIGFLFILLGLTLIVGLLSGLYPASVLSSFKPVEVLKSSFQRTGSGAPLRKVLVTLQFVISIALIASTILVYRQLKFVQNKKLGFDKEKLIVATLQSNTEEDKLNALKTAISNTSGVQSVAAASTIPGVTIPMNLIHNETAGDKQNRSMQMLFVDHDFVKTLQMKIAAGREFSTAYGTDANEGFIINREAVKQLGWESANIAIGKSFQWVNPDTVLKSGTIIGVVEDFNITPLKTSIQPLVMHIHPRRFKYLYIRISSNVAISSIEKQFKQINPDQPFEYVFLDDVIQSMYSSEIKLGKIFGYFSGLAILIACMGIFGLSIYSIQQRIREIGIRKVLGASIVSITSELTREFLKPVFIAACIAAPIAWYGMHMWLQDFAYRISIEWWVFVVAAIISVVIAVVTVSFQSIRAALANPTTSLRGE